MRVLKLVAMLLLLGLVGLSSSSNIGQPKGMELTVCPQGPPMCDFSKIQQAIDAAPEGATIRISEGTYVENLTIRKSVRLIGMGQDKVFIKYILPEKSQEETSLATLMIGMIGVQRPIQVWIEGLSIIGPTSPPAIPDPSTNIQGIWIEGQVQAVLQKLTVSGYSIGINILAEDPHVILQNVTLSHNFNGITVSGGGITKSTPTLIQDSIITENGGGVVGSDFVLERSTVTRNQEAGIVIFPRGERSVIIIRENIISENGNGIWVFFFYRGSVDVKPLIGIGFNRIVSNREYGVVIQTAECMGVKKEGESGPVQVEGVDNEIRDNGKGDLCPADYPWPPDFKSP